MAQEESLVVPSITGTDIDLLIAGPGGRAYAFVIDFHIRILVAIAWLVIAAQFVTGNVGDLGQAGILLYAVPPVTFYLLYHPVLEIVTRGSTPGKRIAGIRIVNREGSVPSMGSLIIRNIFRLIDSLPTFYLTGLLTTMFSKQHLRFGDMAAGTLLIYENKQKPLNIDQLSKLEDSSISPEMLDLATDLLGRWNKLDPDIRHKVAAKLLPADVLENVDSPAELKKLVEDLVNNPT